MDQLSDLLTINTFRAPEKCLYRQYNQQPGHVDAPPANVEVEG